MRSRILFLAGASATGKTTVGEGLQRGSYGILLYGDNIASRAGRHYFPGCQDNFCSWPLWKPELDDVQKRDRLLMAFRRSMIERKTGPHVRNGKNLIIEGVLAGHPTFRSVMRDVLHELSSFCCDDTDVAVFWLDPPIAEVLTNIGTRNRPQEHSEATIRERNSCYKMMMSGQNVSRFESSSACTDAALLFLS